MTIKKTYTLFVSIIFLTVFVFVDYTRASSIDISKYSLLNKTEVYKIYDDLPHKIIDFKMSKIQNTFMFFRSFVLVFYKMIDNNKQELSSLFDNKLYNFTGNSLVDYHIDNFNLMITNRDSQFVYTMNDIDEGCSNIPIFTDLLRYLTSLQLNTNNPLSQNEYLELLMSYQNSLRGDYQNIPQYIKQKINDLHFVKLHPSKKNQKYFYNLSSFRTAEKLTSREKNIFHNKIYQIFGKEVQITKELKFLNIIGGSGGLMRYRFVIKISKHNFIFPIFNKMNLSKKQIIEFKELRIRKNPLSTKINKKNQDTNNIKQMLVNQNLSLYIKDSDRPLTNLYPFYNIYTIGQKAYLLRPKWKGAKTVDMSNLRGEQYFQTAKFQISLIAKFARKVLKNKTQDYLKLINKVEPQNWILASKIISNLMVTNFKLLK